MATALLTVGVLFKFIIQGADEAPIRVRNGSLDIFAGNESGKRWKWEQKEGDNRESTQSYSHEPEHISLDADDRLWVKVIPGSGGGIQCKQGQQNFDGDRVVVGNKVGSDTLETRIRRGNRNVFGLGYRTRVRPRLSFEAVTDQTLRQKGTTIGVGFVSQVRAGYRELYIREGRRPR